MKICTNRFVVCLSRLNILPKIANDNNYNFAKQRNFAKSGRTDLYLVQQLIHPFALFMALAAVLKLLNTTQIFTD